MAFDLLVKMQPSRKKPKAGDVFVIQPKEDLYFYGKVVRTNLPSRDMFIRGSNLIYIYKMSSKEIIIPSMLDLTKLLIPPQIVNNQGWNKGYFQTIGNIPVTNNELALNFGFKDFLTKQFVDADGNPLGFEPELWTDYGMGSYGVVASDIHKVLNANPDLTS